MDLNKLYDKQAKLDKHILEKHNIKINKEELLDNTILALLVEVGELANTTRCFKHWSIKGMMDKEVVIEELSDVWHFYLSVGNQADIYLNKNIMEHHANIKKFYFNITENSPTNNLINNFKNLYKYIGNFIESKVSDDGIYDYVEVGINLYNIAKNLNFTDKEVEQAYLKKHEENYKRQREGY